jgi:hypothetical protein
VKGSQPPAGSQPLLGHEDESRLRCGVGGPPSIGYQVIWVGGIVDFCQMTDHICSPSLGFQPTGVFPERRRLVDCMKAGLVVVAVVAASTGHWGIGDGPGSREGSHPGRSDGAHARLELPDPQVLDSESPPYLGL